NLDGRAEARPISQEERFRRKVLVIVDNMTTTRFNRDRALDRLEQFVNDHFVGGDYDWSLALFDRRAHLLLAPTSDKHEVFKAIGEIRRLVAGDMARLTADNRLEPLAINLTDGVGTSVNDLACAGQRLS